MAGDADPIIYTLEAHERFAERFAPLFQRHAAGELVLAVTTVAVAEVLTGPLRAGEEALAKRYRGLLESWRVVELSSDIAESAARLREQYGLKLRDAIQLASALAINAEALVTHDRDFAQVRGMRVLG
ncbi:Predicted nucleic acid-binding protein, contains PIN domain [Aquimonas voraii]|uniref:Predicted nucleic acid-binding protein, contains PIN domain n=1 Tax=Aquimonas voraii TaxID=265719 RepID=A0A1G6WKN9_9GAMM|nr:Predicted nucleic acid-binding protein, contains PIN domain [Aquimonas voraii]